MAINLVKTKKATIEDWELLVDSNLGVYVPQTFARSFGHYLPDSARKSVYEKSQLDVLLSGPDNEDYWDAWDEILNETITNEAGETFTLHQDGDLWAVPTSFDWDTFEDC